MSHHWAQRGEATFVLGMKLLYAIHQRLGRGPFVVCMTPVLAWYWLTRPAARAASRQFQARVAAQRGTPAASTWAHLRAFADTMLDKLLAMHGRFPAHRVRAEGDAAVWSLIHAGRGALLLTAHMGCLELCQALAQRDGGFRLTVLVHTRHAERFNRVLRQLNPNSPVELLQVTELTPASAVLLADRIGRGELVAMAADRVPVRPAPGATVQAEFLGAPAPWPIGPHVLAALLQCPVFFMSCVCEGSVYVQRFVPLAERVVLPRAQRREALTVQAQRFAHQLEAQALATPLQWFNFFPFWDQPA